MLDSLRRFWHFLVAERIGFNRSMEVPKVPKICILDIQNDPEKDRQEERMDAIQEKMERSGIKLDRDFLELDLHLDIARGRTKRRAK